MTTHKADCNMVFGRKDPTCPRCQELLNGAAAKEGWQKAYYSKKEKEKIQLKKAIKSHFSSCRICHYGEPGVCTALEW